MAIIDKMMVYGGITRLKNKCTEHKAQNANNFLDKPLVFIKNITCTHPEIWIVAIPTHRQGLST